MRSREAEGSRREVSRQGLATKNRKSAKETQARTSKSLCSLCSLWLNHSNPPLTSRMSNERRPDSAVMGFGMILVFLAVVFAAMLIAGFFFGERSGPKLFTVTIFGLGLLFALGVLLVIVGRGAREVSKVRLRDLRKGGSYGSLLGVLLGVTVSNLGEFLPPSVWNGISEGLRHIGLTLSPEWCADWIPGISLLCGLLLYLLARWLFSKPKADADK